jgi:tRNA G10  N-methylase Trm11
MPQRYKSVYFPDLGTDDSAKKSLTLAFGESDADLHLQVSRFTCYETRKALGFDSHRELARAARKARQPLNTYCLSRLRANGVHERENQGTPAAFQIDAIQSTFRGGKSEPLHDWYPYLEGYSPAFVEEVLRRLVPNARTILDPFGGVGTTPLVAARMGRTAYFCELNPLLQRLIEAKSLALSLAKPQRTELADGLDKLAGRVPLWLESANPCPELRSAYRVVFGDSVFFSIAELDRVLRARMALDKMEGETPLLAFFAELAVCSSLIPASLLIRRGDLRYMTPAEACRRDSSLGPELTRYLRLFASDLRSLEPIPGRPLIATENARELGKVPSLGVDAVVTSPPYLNGTNYFRNTKVELWFLRALKTEADLRAFRLKTVTAGINDVTNERDTEPQTPAIARLVSRLAREGYDRRIAQMVAGYFSDMAQVFDALQHHLTDGAKIVMDIGDSSYGGIHVPTDKLLTALLAERGFSLERDIALRTRSSRGGAALRQTLLVYGRETQARWLAADLPAALPPRWDSAWRSFTCNLPHQQSEYARRNWGNGLHSLCSYQGKMKPALAHFLVATFVPKGGRMLDPFAGVGTIPFEAALQGATTWGFDISPTALAICAAKLSPPARQDCDRVLERLARALDAPKPTPAERASAQAINFNSPLPDYFAPRTLDEILIARRFFAQRPLHDPAEAMVFASLLHILHGNRPYALSRRSHPITPFAPTGSAEYRPLLPRLRAKVTRSLDCVLPPEMRPGRTLHQDATSWWPHDVDQLDAIITSPPFFDSTRFYLANWMRLWFAGWEAADFRTQPLAFVDERQKQDFAVYEPLFRQARERLKTSGVLVLHLGKSRKCDMAVRLAEVAKRWFRVADLFNESVAHCESHGIADKGTVTEHQFLVLD